MDLCLKGGMGHDQQKKMIKGSRGVEGKILVRGLEISGVYQVSRYKLRAKDYVLQVGKNHLSDSLTSSFSFFFQVNITNLIREGKKRFHPLGQ